MAPEEIRRKYGMPETSNGRPVDGHLLNSNGQTIRCKLPSDIDDLHRRPVKYEHNVWELKSTQKEGLKRLAEAIRVKPSDCRYTWEIKGHTDMTGTREYNCWLSQKRSGAVKDVLVPLLGGFDIVAKGMCWDYPEVKTERGVSEPANRRVAMLLL